VTAGPRAVVWAGASYSWTWWADMLEDLGWLDATFPTDPAGLRAGLDGAGLLLVGGGDASVVSDALDRARARHWLDAGGTAVGTCAGAYAMRRWAGVRVLNAADAEPRGAPARAWSRCAEGLVVHVARGPVRLTTADGRRLVAHLYGGPVLDGATGTGVRVLSRYDGAAEGAEVLLPGHRPLLDGTPAVVACGVGRGRLLLSGPHLEHPDCGAARAWLAGQLGLGPIDAGRRPSRAVAGRARGDPLLARLSEVRRTAISAGDLTWSSGDRTWSAQRVAAMADAVLQRASALRSWGWPLEARHELRALGHVAGRSRPASTAVDWDAVLLATSTVGGRVMGAYFEALRAGMPRPARRRPSRLRAEGHCAAGTGRTPSRAMGVARP